MSEEAGIDTLNTEPIAPPADAPPIERDYEVEAKTSGWRPPEEFPGDGKKLIGAKEWVERGETYIPFLKKDRDETKRELADLRRTVKQYAKHAEKVEERAYQRAIADLRVEHREAVETGDIAAAERASDQIATMKADAAAAPKVDDELLLDPVAARKELNDWVEENDWYVLDDGKRRYADMQAETMGPARDWPEGNGAWLAELGKRVDRKFAAQPVSPTNGGGNRSAPGVAGKSYNDLPAAAKAACDKYVKSGLIKSREQYVKDYQFD